MRSHMILKLTLDLPEEQAYIRITRLLGRTLLEHLNACEQDVDELELVVGELCANVVRHARSTENRFQVILEYHSDRVGITVRDQGPGFSVSSILPVGTERADFAGEPDRIGGFGLKLVELLSDKLEFRTADPRGTSVRAEKRIHYKTEADAERAEKLGRGGGESHVAMGSESGSRPVLIL